MKSIPVYSLGNFINEVEESYSIEIFDANRHFEVQYPHKHDFFEVLFLLKGSGNHIIDNNKYEVKPPCIFFLSPGQAHKLELSKDIAGYIFLFTGEFYQLGKSNKNKLLEYPFFFNLKQDNPPLQIEKVNEVRFLSSLFRRGSVIMEQNVTDKGDLAHALLELILCTCQQLYPDAEQDGEKRKGHLLVKRFRELIEEKYHVNLTIKQYADELGVSENHLTFSAKELTGKTSKALIKQKQIVEIKRLLKYTDMSIKEICLQFQFSDQSYFSKFFKREVGISPVAFRNQSLKNT